MVQFLLNCGHKPDIFFSLPLVTRCVIAVMSTITRMTQPPWLSQVWHASTSGQANTLHYPYSAVIFFHFVVATLNLDLTKHVLAAMGWLFSGT